MTNKRLWQLMNELSPNLFMLYVAIAKLEDNKAGYCFATNQTLGEKLNKHKDTICKEINKLKKLGFITVIEINKKGNYCDERRIYTNENVKYYLRDLANLKNLKKTEIKNIENIPHLINEFLCVPIKERIKKGFLFGVKEVKSKAIDKNTDRGIDENAYETKEPNLTKNNLNKIGGFDFEKKLKENGINLSIGAIKNLSKKNLTLEKVEEVIRWAKLSKMAEGAVYKALNENWKVKVIEKKVGTLEKINIMKKELGEAEIARLQKEIFNEIQLDGLALENELSNLLCQKYNKKYSA